jgi:hypothetical protein
MRSGLGANEKIYPASRHPAADRSLLKRLEDFHDVIRQHRRSLRSAPRARSVGLVINRPTARSAGPRPDRLAPGIESHRAMAVSICA